MEVEVRGVEVGGGGQVRIEWQSEGINNNSRKVVIRGGHQER
jgi:hypothetical protein